MIRQADVFLKKRVELDRESERNTMALLDFIEKNVVDHYYQMIHRKGERTMYMYVYDVELGGFYDDLVKVKCVNVTFQEIDEKAKDGFGLMVDEDYLFADELPIFENEKYEVTEIDSRVFRQMLDKAYETICKDHLRMK